MAKKPPHKRQKKHNKKLRTVEPKAVELKTDESKDTKDDIVQERSWVLSLVFAFIVFIFIAGIWLFFVNKDTSTQNNTAVESAVSGGGGVTIDGGNLGQISNGATSGIQSNSNPLSGSALPSNPSSSSSQSSQLQPTIDKCTYQQFDQSNPSAPCSY